MGAPSFEIMNCVAAHAATREHMMSVQPLRKAGDRNPRTVDTARSGKQKGYQLKKGFRVIVNDIIANVWEGEWHDGETASA
jgi:hypothetical protein